MLKHALTAVALVAICNTPLSPAGAAALEGEPKANEYWWPERLNLSPLRQNADRGNPLGENFDYAAAFATIDLDELKADIGKVLTTSQDWWPADYGNYGPLFVRLSWHAAGTYRVFDGRGGAGGGQQRFEPLNSWPDNTNLDKARRLLWPIKQKYGQALSWADLIVFSGTIAMEQMGFELYGFAGGREDDWEPDLVYWGPESGWLEDARYSGDRQLEKPLAAVQMGLIYVNPEGPNGNPDPVAAARDIRETFARMAMDDEETVALIAGGHTFGKTHGAHSASCLGANPGGAPVEAQGLGWKNSCGTGKGGDTVTSGLEGAWTSAPAQWTHQYFQNLFQYEWVKTESPAGATQWIPKDGTGDGTVPDAHDANKFHAPIMLTTDLSLRFDPAYEEISRRFLEDPKEFEKAFARAWFKLTHRDMGPRSRYIGAYVPEDALTWQDPIPAVDHTVIDGDDIATLKAEILKSGVSAADLVRTAWASAASYRHSDGRGGANGARIRLAPMRDWAVNDPATLSRVLTALEGVQQRFNAAQNGNKRVSLADVIVLAGAAAIEQAAGKAGHTISVPFTPGRADASADQTDVASFQNLEQTYDGFRNYLGIESKRSPSQLLVDRADQLDLTVPELTALVGGLRVLDANTGGAKHGVLTRTPGTLDNAFFVNLMNLDTEWAPASDDARVYEGKDRKSGETLWTATEVDLVFGSNAELRAVAEVYAFDDGEKAFVDSFVRAWAKVMMLDRQ